MYLSFLRQTLLSGALLGLSSVVLADKGPPKSGSDPLCASGPFATQLMSGTPTAGKQYYCDSKWNRSITVTGIEAWATDWQLKGLQFTYSDGTKSPVRGQATGDHGHVAITWGMTDTITHMQMWGNYAGDAVGRIQMTASNGASLDVGSDVGSSGGDSVTLGSGILLGGDGDCSDMVLSLRWMFLSGAIGTASITALDFDDNIDTWNAQKKGVTQASLEQVYIKNSNTNSVTKTYTFANSQTKTAAVSVATQTEHIHQFNPNVQLGAKAPKVPLFGQEIELSGQVDLGGSYQWEDLTSTTTSNGQIETLTWSESAPLAPGRAANCTSTALMGVFSDSFSSTVVVTLVDGQSFQVTERGSFGSTGWGRATSNCIDIPLANAPDDAVEAPDPGSKKRGTAFAA